MAQVHFSLPGAAGQLFSLNNTNPDHLELAGRIVSVYNQIPSTDIWNIESINSTIRQIEFYRAVGTFETAEDLQRLYASVFRLIDHIERQAEAGVKFMVGAEPVQCGGLPPFQQ